ncbi:MAG: hypothetical protein K2P17_05050 [Helicobacteraceae bacterium]|nr:hypothetical protein [Helicobacteraceae bacterium]
MLDKALFLKKLYLKRLCGEMYCDEIIVDKGQDKIFKQDNLDEVIANCSLCELNKSNRERISGILVQDSPIAFITIKPLARYSASFDMVANIAKNVFNEKSYSLLSLVKCNTYTQINDTHIKACLVFLKSQLDSINPKLIIIFGSEILRHFSVDENIENLRGRIFDNLLNKQRDFIVTYQISDLLKNQQNKKNAMQDFKIAKAHLENKIRV